jgi:hypothetical protein
MAAIAGETFEIADVMSDVASAFGRVFGVDFVEEQATDDRQQRGIEGEQTTDDRQQRVGDAGDAASLRSGAGRPVEQAGVGFGR